MPADGTTPAGATAPTGTAPALPGEHPAPDAARHGDSPAPHRPVARVVLDSPLPQLDRLFDYRIPDGLAATCVPGVRVRVPLRTGARMADAYVVEVVDEGTFPGDLSPIEDVVSPVPVLRPEVWRLARAVADRSAGVASDVLRLAVPTRQARVEKAFLARDTAVRPAPVTATPISDAAGGAAPGPTLEAVVTERRRAALDAVPHPVQLPDGSWVPGWARTLAEAATHAIAAERSAIIAVPDFRDLADLERALAAVLPAERIVRFDAKQSNPQRARALLTAATTAVVAIGNRSAVYAPATDLGLIAMWDDGDESFVEPRAPYAHTRDVALLRTAQSGAALVLAAHARSTDVQRLVELGWLESLAPHRAVTPHVVPTAQQTSAEGFAAQARIPSAAWRGAREASREGPVLVQVASPGYAPTLVCADCGDRARCPRCGGPLGNTADGGVPHCRWCGALAVGYRCPTCNPGTRIIVADGAHPIDQVDDRPAVVVATRGAEPAAPGGYHAVLLLDGERMLAREGLRVAEDVLRLWANAAARAARGAPVFLVGIGGRLATAMATWRLEVPAHEELADRRVLHFPPAVRVATLTGAEDAVSGAVDALGGAIVGPVLGPVPLDDGSGGVRAIVRFPYAHGTEVAATLKAEVIRRSSTRRVVAGGARRRAAPTLRVRLDDVEPFSAS